MAVPGAQRYLVYPQHLQHHLQSHSPQQSNPTGGMEPGAPGAAGDSPDDELMFLFDVIRRKTERLKSDYEEIKMQVSMRDCGWL